MQFVEKYVLCRQIASWHFVCDTFNRVGIFVDLSQVDKLHGTHLTNWIVMYFWHNTIYNCLSMLLLAFTVVWKLVRALTHYQRYFKFSAYDKLIVWKARKCYFSKKLFLEWKPKKWKAISRLSQNRFLEKLEMLIQTWIKLHIL